MKKIMALINITLLLIVFSVAQIISAAEKNDQTKNSVPTTQNAKDAKITSDIMQKIAEDNSLSGIDINVVSKSGVVNLSGNVNTKAEAVKIIEIAEAVQGVKRTETGKLTVKEQSDQPFSDAAITAKVKGIYIREKLFGTDDVAVMDVKVETNNGVVYLTGTVDNLKQAETAIKLAHSVSGVKRVDSKINVLPSTPNNSRAMTASDGNKKE